MLKAFLSGIYSRSNNGYEIVRVFGGRLTVTHRYKSLASIPGAAQEYYFEAYKPDHVSYWYVDWTRKARADDHYRGSGSTKRWKRWVFTFGGTTPKKGYTVLHLFTMRRLYGQEAR